MSHVSQIVLSMKESLLVLKKEQGDRLLYKPPSIFAAGNVISCCQELMQMRVEKHGERECYAFFLTDHTRGKGDYVMENLKRSSIVLN